MTDDVVARLAGLGLTLPEPPQPLGAYQAVVRTGSLLFVSMQGPAIAGEPVLLGRIGAELTVDEGREAARRAVLNALAQLHRHLGSFNTLVQLVRLDGYITCSDDFTGHAQVLDAASELLVAVLGDRGAHVRTVCGVRNLPGGLPVGLALTCAVQDAPAAASSGASG
ncbi:RidA family protein [Jeongeupia naejangsanensis]|uniref:RidA family protein n=1 Tax=Jeongeupia naejangsanensis TaxID=613195 RepID=A0ABS2BFV6_9NEIS|nr:RidA family protein [Jeongeupia naejangsanensis]MBM3114489.1 RidA family protein [Jeongeupia naejangsanensis]